MYRRSRGMKYADEEKMQKIWEALGECYAVKKKGEN